MRKPSFDEMTAFCEIARKKSFSKAADYLGVSRSALSHTMKGLETQVGAQLLRRTTRSVSLTQAGEQLYAGLQPLLNDFDKLMMNISADNSLTQGIIRINGSEGAIAFLLENVLPSFSKDFPGIEFDLVSDGPFIDIVEQNFDAGLRLGESVPKDMIGLPMGAGIRFVAIASPGFLSVNTAPEQPDDLIHLECIRQRLPSGKRYHWEFSKGSATINVDVSGKLTLDNNTLMVKSALQGLGVAYVPEAYAEAYVKRGELVYILEDWCPRDTGFYIYFPRYRHMSRSFRVFLDFIKDWQAAK